MTMRPKKRRSSGHVYETVPNSEQVRFPAPKRTIREKRPRWSAKSKNQQTITQMNPFRAIFHPETEHEDLEYDEEEPQSYVVSPMGKKRRKITPESPPARKIETRSSARKAVKAELTPKVEESPLRPLQSIEKESLLKLQSPASLMPPPQTPRTVRKREIPSSQSPVDSPLSTQSRTPARCYARSPLKERSTNTTISTPTLRKASRWVRKLEVADSYEYDENQGCIQSPIITRTKGKSSGRSPGGFAHGEITQVSQHEPAVPGNTAKEILESSQGQRSGPRVTGQATADVIFDSDTEFETDDNDLGEAETNESHRKCTNQANDQEPSTPFHQKQSLGRVIRRGSDRPENPHSDELGPVINFQEDAYIPQEPRSESEEASAQLFNDLHRATAPGGLQTESQFENEWVPYNPAAISNHSSSPIEIVPSPSPEPEDPAPNTVPTQLLSPSAAPFRKQPVPPSQATTTDGTQRSSPRKMPSSSSLVLPSSPPPMPPPPPSSSSPIMGHRGADPWAGFEWNGVRLTDSQLLPESLLNDSIGGPPGGMNFDEEDLVEE